MGQPIGSAFSAGGSTVGADTLCNVIDHGMVVEILKMCDPTALKETVSAALRKLFKERKGAPPSAKEEKEIAQVANRMIRAATDEEVTRYDTRAAMIVRVAQKRRWAAAKKAKAFSKSAGAVKRSAVKKAPRSRNDGRRSGKS
jgi:hypothetical protein